MTAPGLGLFYAGLSRTKHALSLMFLSLMSMAVVFVQWWLWGYSLTFSETGGKFIGDFRYVAMTNIGWQPNPVAPTIPQAVFVPYQGMFAAITPALAFGASAERMRIMPALLFLFIWSTLVYSICTYWVWGPNGWLRALGVLDYAGGLCVHISSGSAAIAYALVLGKRSDYDHGAAQPHNVSFVFIGTGLLWFGWLGFNGGSSFAANTRAGLALLCSQMSACFGAIVWTAMDYRHDGKLSLIGFCTGAVAGLATITPASGFISPPYSIIFGVVGSAICNLVVTYKRKLHFDDALDVFAVHWVGSFVGLILLGVFCTTSVTSIDNPIGVIPPSGWIDQNWIQVPIQLAGIASVTAWSFCVTFIILFIMNKIPGLHLRVDEMTELLGTDAGEIGETAYAYVETMSQTSQAGSLERQLDSMRAYDRPNVTRDDEKAVEEMLKAAAKRDSTESNASNEVPQVVIMDSPVKNQMTQQQKDESRRRKSAYIEVATFGGNVKMEVPEGTPGSTPVDVKLDADGHAHAV
jgi:Amt family ammonium transporter